MKKKTINLGKLNLNKETIAGLTETNKILGGATMLNPSCALTCFPCQTYNLCPSGPEFCPTASCATNCNCPSIDICPGSLDC